MKITMFPAESIVKALATHTALKSGTIDQSKQKIWFCADSLRSSRSAEQSPDVSMPPLG
jgi:HD superfamily phosphohydrolase YqeK